MPELAGGVFAKPGKEVADILKEWLGGAALGEGRAGAFERGAAPARPRSPRPRTKSKESRAWPCLPRSWRGSGSGCVLRAALMNELAELKKAIEEVAGSAGVTEYYRILRQHGAAHPRQFRSMQPARLCAKDVYLLLERLRANMREKEQKPDLGARAQTRCIRNGRTGGELWQTT